MDKETPKNIYVFCCQIQVSHIYGTGIIRDKNLNYQSSDRTIDKMTKPGKQQLKMFKEMHNAPIYCSCYTDLIISVKYFNRIELN